MAKILFIQANYDLNHLGESPPWMPLALVELATYLRENGHEVKLLDRNINYDNNLLLKYLKNFNPDIVGMTCYTSPVIKDIKQISKITKENSNALVIIGGIHATLEPKSLLDFPYIDYIIRGEGEETLLEICNLSDSKRLNKKNILKIKNVNYNRLRPILDLTSLPAPDYSLLEIKRYPITTFYTSRGCPGRCRFCYNLGRRLRFYDTNKVIETMSSVLGKYHIKEFTIADDNFANLGKRTETICNELSKYNAIFHIFLRVDQTYNKVMSNLKKAGCWAIQFGFESGNQRILDFIHKDTTIEQNANAIKQCKKYGIFVDGSFMIGLPTETTQEMYDTINFIKKYRPDSVDIKVYKPYPSTELAEYAIQKKLFKKPEKLEEWENFCNLKEGNINLSNIPTRLLLENVNRFSKSDYFTYIKKTAILLNNGHYKYVFFKSKNILMQKFGIKQDSQKTRKSL